MAGPELAGATTGPQINLITGYAGAGGTPIVGTPVVANSAAISPTYISYDPTTGDEVLVASATNKVYLIAGADEQNAYHIETTGSSVSFSTLVKGDAYLVAGNGTRHIITNPGLVKTTNGGSKTPQATANDIAPLSAAFDHTGNLLIGEKSTTGQTATAIQVVARGTCSSACPYGLSSMAAGDLYTIAASGLLGVNQTVVVPFTFGVFSTGLVVDGTTQGNLIAATNGSVVFINEQATALTRYGVSLSPHQATVVAGTTSAPATRGGCTTGGAKVVATGTSATPNIGTTPHLAIDPSGNLYITDNRTGATHGCTWLLPAGAGSLDGRTVTPGYLYALTGTTAAAAATAGALATAVSFPSTEAVTVDRAGNVVVATAGSTPSLRVIAESSGTYYGQTMDAGHVYFIAGGAGATIPTGLPSTAYGFKLLGPTALANGASGTLLVTDGGSATTQDAYVITGAPTTVANRPTIGSVTPTSGPTSGGTLVTITGTDLSGALAVHFGTVAGTTVDAISTTSVSVVDPPHALGTVNVSVTTPGGTGVLATGFTYRLPTPTLTAIAPDTGSTKGGRTVTLHGEHLHGTIAVTFGPNSVSGIHVLSTSAVTVVTPPNATTGSVSVSLTTGGGTAKLPGAFTYVTGTAPGSPVDFRVSRPISGGVIQGREVQAAWTKPAADGGLAIQGYTVTGSPGGVGCSTTGALTCTVSGLTNGVSYTFTVVAVTEAATSAPAGPLGLAPGTVPRAPGVPTAVPGNASATVRWTAPTPTTSGFPVTGYTVTSSPTDRTCSWGGTGTYLCTVTGLHDGRTYNFTVTATNAVGTSIPSPDSLYPVTPSAEVPGAPTNVLVFPHDASATVIWTPPATTGGSPITNYTVTATPGGQTCTDAAAWCTVDGLKNGTPYTFTVRATNAYGTGLASPPSSKVFPTANANQGFWEVGADGGVFSFGTAQYYGSMGGTKLNAPVVGIASTITGEGYWEVASDGGIFAFGTAQFYGSMGGTKLNAPVVGIAAAPTGKGYWEVAADGGIFAFGTAHFYGSMGGIPLNAPVVGIAVAPTGRGYWEVASDGGIFAFSATNAHPEARFYGSMGGQVLNAPMVGMQVAGTDKGYWEVASDGGIFAFGAASFVGSSGAKALTSPVVGVASTPTAKGYWEADSDGAVYAYGTAAALGSEAGQPLTAAVVGVAGDEP